MTRSAFTLAVVLAIVAPLAAQPPNTSSMIRVVRQEASAESLAARQRLRQEVPVLRGYRVPLGQEDISQWPFEPPDMQAPPPFRAAAQHVAEHLSCDGLIPTTAMAIHLLGPAHFMAADGQAVPMLRSVGIPTDLLAWFSHDGSPQTTESVITHLATLLGEATSAEAIAADLEGFAFMPTPAAAGLTLAAEDGRGEPKLVRMQLSKAERWRGPGDGSAMDIAEQLFTALPETDFVISTSLAALSEIEQAASKWPIGRNGRLILVGGPWRPEQWAQDNGKPAVLGVAGSAPLKATLAPRYASRGEERTTLDPGETFTLEGLIAAGHRVIQSPLLFQGGNLLMIEEPEPRQRVLLVGEAEVYRNTALGLSEPQAVEALRVQCGADRCVVLPAVSFHIDVEVCVRVDRGRVIALVNDEAAAARLVIEAVVGKLAEAGLMDRAIAEQAQAAAREAKDSALVELLAPAMAKLTDENGQYPLSLAQQLAAGPTDSGVGNLERLLLSLDLVAALQIGAGEMPSDPAARAYIQAIQRRAADRAALHAILRAQRWQVVAIPGIADESRGLAYVNGFHVPGQYLMPAYGGVLASVDAAASAAIERTFEGKVRVTPILCGETQRRLGAIHCAASVYCLE